MALHTPVLFLLSPRTPFTIPTSLSTRRSLRLTRFFESYAHQKDISKYDPRTIRSSTARREVNTRVSFFDPANQAILDRLIASEPGAEGGGDGEEETAQATMNQCRGDVGRI